MAVFSFTPPTPHDLAEYKQLDSVDDLDAPPGAVAMFLQIAADMLTLATGATAEPDLESPLGRMVKIAILDMAWHIGTSMEDRDALFSPFSSERIGSYTYSKSSRAVQESRATGVPFFDLVLKYWSNMGAEQSEDLTSVTSEHVFSQPLRGPQAYDSLGIPTVTRWRNDHNGW